MLKYSFFILFLIHSLLVIGQINLENTANHHTHQDSSFSCGACSAHLLDANNATLINKYELHYHGVATDSSKTAFHCAGCKSHLGYYQQEGATYQVLNDKVIEKDTSGFHCLSCQMLLFDKEDLSKSEETSSYFSKPTEENRIALDERNKFYKLQGSEATCGRCDSVIGEVDENDSGGFGLRLNVGAIKKEKRQ